MVTKDIALEGYRLMSTAKSLTELYEANKSVCSKYVHATSRGHEAIQIACGLQLKPQDFVFPYYRDDSILLSIGMTPFQLMLQVLAKRNDPFSGGRTYYSHPSLKDDDKPKIPHQSSATGMQAIPATGVAMGIQHKEKLGLAEDYNGENPVVVCSLGDASCTEGEVSEAFQMAVLKKMPIIYLVQDNEWDISASAEETRAQDITHYAKGFKGMGVRTIDGTNFQESYDTFNEVIAIVRKERRPFIIHAKVPLLNHHTSGVRMEFYRHDKEELAEAWSKDPFPKLKQALKDQFKVKDFELIAIENKAKEQVAKDYELALAEEDPRSEDLTTHMFAPTPVTQEKGERTPAGKNKTVMVDSALFAIREIMAKHPESLLYGQDVGARIGGVFREAATLAQQFGDDRVFNTPIQEAFIVGSTVGMSAVGLKPIVEVQFADYIWPGLNQLFTEVGRSYYLSNGKWPVSMILRVPIGAYGSGGPYHSSSVESIVTNIRGVKVAYPSTGADLKGLMKAAYYDPNPVVMLEHKGLYWSKIKGTEGAMTVEPDEDYIIPFGKARTVLEAPKQDNSVAIITYGMGVYWSLAAEKNFKGQVEIIDLRTLNPLDEEAMYDAAKKHNKILIVTEESVECSFSLGLVARIQKNCFEYLDAPVEIIGSVDTPAIPLNSTLEATLLPNADKVGEALKSLLKY
ncbi:tungsten formylmethanofuran dehydrogenase [Vicingus serpentipes]|uniref:3-methyl-2-oxobutanoate dehydrogenase (2-methylpropanoyl-transferring) n=2 Tax=Vicingus serpentipes TaxID=1926625 RepID=A0A5C6RZ83_9FLAO|nr:tungsten formylmethanofuran dehydrogenase [Vicingus serpentipes]